MHWTWAQIWVQARIPYYSLNRTARSSAIQRRHIVSVYQLAHPKVAQPKSAAFRPQVCLCWTVFASVKTNSNLMLSATTHFRLKGYLFSEISQMRCWLWLVICLLEYVPLTAVNCCYFESYIIEVLFLFDIISECISIYLYLYLSLYIYIYIYIAKSDTMIRIRVENVKSNTFNRFRCF